jgi:indole-3-glycerol phosphate synthase
MVLSSGMAELRARARDSEVAPSFVEALRAGETVAVIAEIKRRSPSKGIINASIRAGAQARAYVLGGAAALSVLTEPAEFGGDTSDLLEIRRTVDVPLLKKDFHVDESQVWEARALGASAMLFIARALPPDRLECLVDEALEAGVAPLVEVRSQAELERALATPAVAIGVNARDLETLLIDVAVTRELLPRIPLDRIAIAESGLSSTADVERAASLGADAVLVGSALSRSLDPTAAARALASVARRSRRG